MRREITVKALPENAGKVTAFVEEILDGLGCSPKSAMQIDLAVDELFGNIACYAYTPGTGTATIRVEMQEDTGMVTITFIDSGRPFDPLAKEDPDVTLSAEERPIGGLGIFLVKKSMDAVRYEYRDGKNILTISKRL